MLIYQLLVLIVVMISSISTTTSIRTFERVELRENVPLNTTVMNLKMTNEKKTKKMVLLNLSGFETNLFEIRGDKLQTKSPIDHEEFVERKWCFDRLNCLIELHLLINDGEEYWVIPFHVIDENDNKPQFKQSTIKMKFLLTDVNEYKIPFEGAIDYDQTIHKKIFYLLDCSKEQQQEEESNLEFDQSNEITKNCYPLFDLIVFSQSLINQYDQLGIKLSNSLSSSLETHYELKLFAFNRDENGKKEMINSMKMFIEIEKVLQPPRFHLSLYRFLVKHHLTNNKNKIKIGELFAKSSDAREKVIYRLKSQRENVEINEKTGELFLLNNQMTNESEMNVIVEAFYLSNPQMKSLTNVHLILRHLDEISQNLRVNYHVNSFVVKQIDGRDDFIIDRNENVSSEDVLLQISIVCSIYPSDQFDLYLLNSSSSFFSLSPRQGMINNYLLKLKNNFLPMISVLFFQVKHRLTSEFVSNLTVTFFTNSSLCLVKKRYTLYNLGQTVEMGRVEVMETNLNVSSFSKYSISNEMVIDECRMIIMSNSTLNQSEYQICSLLSNECYQISMRKRGETKILMLKRMLGIRPIEITILCLSLIFILSTITIIFIICRLRGFSLCLSVKNYLFYGKKYGLNHSQHLHNNTKINVRLFLSSKVFFSFSELI